MATWLEIATEMQQSNPDTVRRAKLNNLFNITKRPVLLYAV